jgi:tetratricopeptide (TPR) repeat protein
MDRTCLLVAVAFSFLSACAPNVPRPVIQAGPTPAMRMAGADVQIRVGCLDCLEQALAEYLGLRSDPAIGQTATDLAARTALLIAVRENELGLLDSGRIREAHDLAGSPSASLSVLMEVADALSSKPRGPSRSPTTDAENRASAAISRNQRRWVLALRQLMPDDLVADYLWLGLACGPLGFDVPDRTDRVGTIGDSLDVPLIRFKSASSCSIQRPDLIALSDAEPRFVETQYLLGVSAFATQLISGADEAEARFQTAYTWRPNWPALTMAIANLALTAENFERAAEFYGKTLELVPDYPEALLSSMRAFTYAGRHAEAIQSSDRLLAINRSPGDARYWRALNEERMDQHDAAWDDIELAAAAMVSPDVPKLAGIIAINRRQLDVARQRLEASLSARPADCETGFYLQAVLTQQAAWNESSRVAANAAACFDADLVRLTAEIDSLQTSEMRADQRDRQIAKRRQQISSETRMRAATWFDAAAASYNLSKKDDARRFAEKLLDDEQYGDRARDLIGRLSVQ